MMVDAHQHYWQPARGDYGWLAQAPAELRCSFLPEDLRPQRLAAGVRFAVLVQAAPTVEETRYLFALARQDPAVIGVVGWVDMASDDACTHIEALLRESDGLLCGIRPMAQDIADPAWLTRPELDRAFGCLQASGLAFDALVTPAQLPALHRRLRRQHHLRAVIDHGGKPPLGGGDLGQWNYWMSELAGLPELHCKLSGLLTLLDAGTGEAAIEPCVQALFERFGADRMLWGSDWPVLTTHAGYDHWLQLAQRLVDRFAPGRQDEVFGANAIRFYGLDRAATFSFLQET